MDSTTTIAPSTSLYVEYVSDRSGEDVFELGGKRWQFVNVRNGKGNIDIGVYDCGGDVCIDYFAWRAMMGIRE
jgi:hypothetical protein